MAKKSSPQTSKMAKKIKKSATIEELDRVAKILVRRDFQLLQTREKLEQSLAELQEKNKELQEKNQQLEKFRRMAVGRELRMVELKKKIKKMKEKLPKEEGQGGR